MQSIRGLLRTVSRTGPLCIPRRHLFENLASGLTSVLKNIKPEQKKHAEKQLIGFGFFRHRLFDDSFSYSQEQMYNVVSDVANYRNFVPWCQRSVVLRTMPGALEAELEIGFGPVTERYISRVQLDRPRSVIAIVKQGKLFDHLNTEWRFEPGPTPQSCLVSFAVDFQFLSPLHAHLANMFYSQVVLRLRSSFEKRARDVYGPSAAVSPQAPKPTTR